MSNGNGSLLQIGTVTIILAILAMIITKDVYVGLSILVLSWSLEITAVIAIIPILGLVGQFIAAAMVWAWLIPMLVIPASVAWIASAAFWIAILTGVLVTVVVIGAIMSMRS